MEIKFIGQGLSTDQSLSTGMTLINAIDTGDYKDLKILAAFISLSGIESLEDSINKIKNNGGDVTIFAGVDLFGTSKEALEKLIDINVDTYIVYSRNRIIYHPKIYILEGPKKVNIILGSSNLTNGGLYQNLEASLSLEYDKTNSKKDPAILSEIYTQYSSLFSNKHKCIKKLDQSLLDLLVESKIVLPANDNRKRADKINKEFGSGSPSNNKKINAIFGQLEIHTAPKPSKPRAKPSKPRTKLTTKVKKVKMNNTALWIETKAMTGAARNILDLSKGGRRDGEVKFGSVSFFGINPNKTETTKSVDIKFNNQVYKGNDLLYAKANANWRLQLKGKTDSGTKLTEISRPQHGKQGGFQNKILVFRDMGNDLFELNILHTKNKKKLTSDSIDWANGGAGNGRAYGIIK